MIRVCYICACIIYILTDICIQIYIDIKKSILLKIEIKSIKKEFKKHAISTKEFLKNAKK